MLAAAVAAVAMMTACTSAQKEEQPVVQDNPEMGVIDNGDSLVVDDVDLSTAGQIAADTVQTPAE